MPTQPHDDTKASRSAEHAAGEPIRFRAATLDEAVALAEKSLGARTRVVAANQLRRGGIGGFFASDLGVEISVVVEDDTVEEALARIVDEAAAEERERWRDRDDMRPAPGAVTAFAAALRTAEDETARAGRRADQTGEPFGDQASEQTGDQFVDHRAAERMAADRAVAAAIAAAQPRPTTSAMRTPARFERMEAAFSSLQAEPASAAPLHREQEPTVVPVAAMPSAARPATTRPAPAEPVAAEPTHFAPARAKRAATGKQPAAKRARAASAEPAPTAAPSRAERHADLVVAATEQLMGTIASRGAAQYSVRVVMRNSEGGELEAFASVDNREAGL